MWAEKPVVEKIRAGLLAAAKGDRTVLGVRIAGGSAADIVAGTCHLLEHMCCSAVGNMHSLLARTLLSARLGTFGGRLSAATGRDAVFFCVEAARGAEERAAEVLRRVLRSALSARTLFAEKETVLAEHASVYASPLEDAVDRVHRLCFAHGLGNTILGTRKSIAEISLETLDEYRRRVFRPQNAVFVYSGLESPAAVARILGACFSRSAAAPAETQVRAVRTAHPDAGGPLAHVFWHSPVRSNATALELVCDILRARGERALGRDVFAFHRRYARDALSALFFAHVRESDGHRLFDALRVPLRDAEVRRASQRMRQRIVAHALEPAAFAEDTASSVANGEEPKSVAERLADVRAATPAVLVPVFSDVMRRLVFSSAAADSSRSGAKALHSPRPTAHTQR